MKTKIINYVRAGYPGLYLVSAEEQRVALEITRIAQELKYNLVFWSVVDGLVDTQKGTNNSANDPLEALIAIRDLKEKTLILLRDFHLFLQDPNPILIRQLKDVLQMAKTKSKTLIILGCRMVLPPELERELTVIEFALPGKEELGAVLSGIMESANIKTMENEQREKVIDAASGLTTIEAENAFALSVVQSKTINPAIVSKEKAQVVKKNGLLELIETKETLDSIGGLDVLKEWLLKRRHAFSARAIEYGLLGPETAPCGFVCFALSNWGPLLLCGTVPAAKGRAGLLRLVKSVKRCGGQSERIRRFCALYLTQPTMDLARGAGEDPIRRLTGGHSSPLL